MKSLTTEFYSESSIPLRDFVVDDQTDVNVNPAFSRMGSARFPTPLVRVFYLYDSILAQLVGFLHSWQVCDKFQSPAHLVVPITLTFE